MGISSIVVVAMFIEAFISYGKTIFDERKIQWQIVAAFIIAAIFCYDTEINLFNLMGVTEKFPIIGTLATALVMCRGSNYFFEFYNQLSTWRKTPALIAENTSNQAMPFVTSEDTPAKKEEEAEEEVIDEIEQEDLKVAK